jgi:cytoskeletal protein CcmA (bactofilin family)
MGRAHPTTPRTHAPAESRHHLTTHMNEKKNRWDPMSHPENGLGDTRLGQSVMDVKSLEYSAPKHGESSLTLRDDNKELQAIIGPGTNFQGTLSFAGRVRIDGDFAGRALGGEVLVIGAGARVSGELRAQQVIVLGGKVDADITATTSIELFVPAIVSGDLRCPHIYMDRGIEFQGTCDMTGKRDDDT